MPLNNKQKTFGSAEILISFDGKLLPHIFHQNYMEQQKQDFGEIVMQTGVCHQTFLIYNLSILSERNLYLCASAQATGCAVMHITSILMELHQICLFCLLVLLVLGLRNGSFIPCLVDVMAKSTLFIKYLPKMAALFFVALRGHIELVAST